MKVLMHMCCGPCAVFPLAQLRQEGIEPEGLFFNPNIHPIDEFEKRRANAVRFGDIQKMKVTCIDDFDQAGWEDFNGADGDRCAMCYSTRLEGTARFAADLGFEAFTSTLLVSPYQKHDLIKQLGYKYAKEYGVAFLYRDFRPGFRRGQQGAKEMGLYRQKYCGCIVSLRERQSHTP